MSFTTHFNGEFIESRIQGLVTAEELIRHARDLGRVESGMPVTPHRITDISGITRLDLDFKGVEWLAAVRRRAQLKNPVRSAIVASDPVQFGFARMFQSLNDHPQIVIQVFRDVPSALAWLREAANP